MTTVTTLDVTGMTCGHCVSAVTSELEDVDGVQRVSVQLAEGGTSQVTVLSHETLAETALREAIDEAGYEVVGISSHDAETEYSELADVRADVYAGTKHAEGEPASDAPGPVAVAIEAKPDVDAASDAASDIPSKAGGCGCGCGCSS